MKAGEYRGLFTASLGIFNLALTFALFRNKRIDSNILYLLIGITLSFISLTAPIQLNGNNITLFWASETVLLYWLFSEIQHTHHPPGIIDRLDCHAGEFVHGLV